MLNYTALTSPTMRCKIHGSMRRAITNTLYKRRQAATIRNKRGEPIMLVWYVRKGFYNSAGQWIGGLVFQDAHTMRNITDSVHKALQA